MTKKSKHKKRKDDTHIRSRKNEIDRNKDSKNNHNTFMAWYW